jgi:hypothetical protein
MEQALPFITSLYIAREMGMWTKMFVMFCVLLVAIVMGTAIHPRKSQEPG